MARAWDADVDVTPELARRLIASQFPQFEPLRLEPFGSGWDNAAFLVNGEYVFRFVRRAFAAQFFDTEVRFLAGLAPRLPLPVPVPEFAGRPQEDFPYGFAGYRMLPGTTACSVALEADERSAIGIELARFLAALHALDLRDSDGQPVPGDLISRHDIARRVIRVREWLAGERAYLPDDLLGQVDTWLGRLATVVPWDGIEFTCHGDLYARHLLVDEQKRLCGVIDWGDLHRGDRAVDLGVAYSFLPPAARPAFFEAYGEIDAATHDRARFRAFHYGSILHKYGREMGDVAMRDAGRLALEFGVAE